MPRLTDEEKMYIQIRLEDAAAADKAWQTKKGRIGALVFIGFCIWACVICGTTGLIHL